jgi:hypothetical protein
MSINPSKFKDQYVTLNTIINGVEIMFQVKLEDEGVVLDIFDAKGRYSKDSDEPIHLDTACKTYQEMEDGE